MGGRRFLQPRSLGRRTALAHPLAGTDAAVGTTGGGSERVSGLIRPRLARKTPLWGTHGCIDSVLKPFRTLWPCRTLPCAPEGRFAGTNESGTHTSDRLCPEALLAAYGGYSRQDTRPRRAMSRADSGQACGGAGHANLQERQGIGPESGRESDSHGAATSATKNRRNL